MQKEHKTSKWQCNAISHKAPCVMESYAEFISHTKSEHPGTFAVNELDELAEYARIEIPRNIDDIRFDDCPLCLTNLASERLKSQCYHIAEELVEIALLSVPTELKTYKRDPQPSVQPSIKNGSQEISIPGVGRASDPELEQTFPWELWETDPRPDRTDYVLSEERVPDLSQDVTLPENLWPSIRPLTALSHIHHDTRATTKVEPEIDTPKTQSSGATIEDETQAPESSEQKVQNALVVWNPLCAF